MIKNKEKMSAAEIVQRQLWRNGYSVKSASLYTNYDFLVDEKIKVEVKRAKYKQNKSGIYWKFKDVKFNADVLAIVITTPLEDILIYYIKIRKNTIEQLRTNKMIVNDKELKINTKELKVLFTDSPSKIFNK